MGQDDFISKINLLENLHEHQALIELDRLEYLSKDGKWKKINVNCLEYLPALLYVGVSINDDMDEIIYKIKYDLLSPHINLTPSHDEKIVFTTNNGMDYPFNIRYESRSNDSYESDNVILRYNNENSNIFSKIKPYIVINDYINKNRYLIREVIQFLNNDINHSKAKINVKK